MKNLFICGLLVAAIIFITSEDEIRPSRFQQATPEAVPPLESSTILPSSQEDAPFGSGQRAEIDQNFGTTLLYYAGDPCTQDCSGHEAGANWAEENDIDDPDDCGGNSDSFIEGCRTFVEDKNEENEENEDTREDFTNLVVAQL